MLKFDFLSWMCRRTNISFNKLLDSFFTARYCLRTFYINQTVFVQTYQDKKAGFVKTYVIFFSISKPLFFMESLKVTYPNDGLLAPHNLTIDDVIGRYQIIWQFKACTDSNLSGNLLKEKNVLALFNSEIINTHHLPTIQMDFVFTQKYFQQTIYVEF